MIKVSSSTATADGFVVSTGGGYGDVAPKAEDRICACTCYANLIRQEEQTFSDEDEEGCAELEGETCRGGWFNAWRGELEDYEIVVQNDEDGDHFKCC